jgi:mannose-6-phosphate isomerase-like protein (cupin superfamily)
MPAAFFTGIWFLPASMEFASQSATIGSHEGDVMSEVVNIQRAFEMIDQFWSPKVLGRVNDQYVKVAKLSGSLTWHKHDGEDELFMVMKGRLTIEMEDREAVHLEAGEFFVVPRGLMHNPVTGLSGISCAARRLIIRPSLP